MSKRHDAIGIKQTIRFEWMQRAANLMLAGLDAHTIRIELHELLSNQQINGTENGRSSQTRTFVVSNLMKVWVSPDTELTAFRDDSLMFLRENPAMDLAVHWGMICAAYPFWFNVAKQTGRLLALQQQVTQAQIINRLKEHYGDRQTVSRNAQFVLRSFVSWGSLKDSEAKGCYERSPQRTVADADLATLLCESALHATAGGKGTLGVLLSSPAFFPFQLPMMTGETVTQRSKRIGVTRYGLDDELIEIKGSVGEPLRR